MIDPGAALAWIKQLPGANPLGKYTGRFLDALLAADPTLATGFALCLPEGEARNDAVRQIASTLAKESLNEAIAWVDQLPDGGAKKQARRELLFAQVEIEPQAALDAASAYPEGASRNDLIDQLASKWTAKDPKSAAAWASRLADEIVRTSIYVSAVQSWFQASPDEAKDFVKSLPEGASRTVCLATLLSQMAPENPVAAAEWARQAGSNIEAQGASMIVNSWAATDPAAAANWINQMPAGDAHDEASTSYAQTIAKLYDAADAMRWVEAIGDETKRSQGIQQIAILWQQQDETAMRAWLENADLSQQLKEQLRQQLHP